MLPVTPLQLELKIGSAGSSCASPRPNSTARMTRREVALEEDAEKKKKQRRRHCRESWKAHAHADLRRRAR